MHKISILHATEKLGRFYFLISLIYPVICVKDTLWVLRRDKPLVHVFFDISLITKHILEYVISLES